MRRFKKFASCILIFAMLISLCSCAGSRRKGVEIDKRLSEICFFININYNNINLFLEDCI